MAEFREGFGIYNSGGDLVGPVYDTWSEAHRKYVEYNQNPLRNRPHLYKIVRVAVAVKSI